MSAGSPPTVIWCPKCQEDSYLFLWAGDPCPDCGEKLQEVCAECHGTGEISLDEDDGEGHTARGVGSKPCPCRITNAKSQNV